MFTVDPTPCTAKNGESLSSTYDTKKQHPFNIGNRQTFDTSGHIVADGDFRHYISEVYFLLSEILNTSKIPDFLNYHYQNATDKTGLIDFISFDLWDYYPEPINEQRKQVISQWIESKKEEGAKLKAFYSALGGYENFQKALELIADVIEKAKKDAEHDYFPTLESVKYYLQANGMVLPKNFDQFWNWFVLNYSDEMDEKGLIEITQDHIADFSRFQTQKIEQNLKQNNNSTQPIGLQCKPEFSEADLKFIFSRLEGKLDKSVTETNFIKAFQAGAIDPEIHWIGSNPELATLIYKLTGLKPIPSIVEPIFKTKYKYDNNSASRTDNKLIEQIIKAAKI